MESNYKRHLILSASVVIAGIILSGPPMVLLIEQFRPQPDWVDVRTFQSNFSRIQTLPFWFGFVLLTGNVYFVASTCRLPGFVNRISSKLAIICVSIYGAIIFSNYAIQTTVVPSMTARNNELVEFLTMVNPHSISWTLEMFGYAVLGVAYWLVSGAFSGNRKLTVLRWMLIINGIISVAGVFLPVISPELLLESGGIASYVIWNLLIVSIMVLVIISYSEKDYNNSKEGNR